MRRGVLVLSTVLLLAAGAAVADRNGDSRERASILKVMRDARSALLADDGRAACSLLTVKGRKRSLAFRVDYDEEGTIPPESPRLPQSCEQIVRREWQDIRRCDKDPQCKGAITWPQDLRRGQFSVAWVRGSRAKVRLKVEADAPVVRFWLTKTPAGWRIDNSDGVPAGH